MICKPISEQQLATKKKKKECAFCRVPTITKALGIVLSQLEAEIRTVEKGHENKRRLERRSCRVRSCRIKCGEKWCDWICLSKDCLGVSVECVPGIGGNAGPQVQRMVQLLWETEEYHGGR